MYQLEFNKSSTDLMEKFSVLLNNKLNVNRTVNDVRNLILSNIFRFKVEKMKSELKDYDDIVSEFYKQNKFKYKPADLAVMHYIEYGYESEHTYRDILQKLTSLAKNTSVEKLEDELLSDEMDIITIEDIDELDGQEFEEFVANLYEKEGYETTLTQSTGDQGVDIIAEDLNEKLAIQTKCYTDKVSNSAVQEAIA